MKTIITGDGYKFNVLSTKQAKEDFNNYKTVLLYHYADDSDCIIETNVDMARGLLTVDNGDGVFVSHLSHFLVG